LLCAAGYSGSGFDKNQPADEGIVNLGPIPQGDWRIGEAQDDARLGPVVMALTPMKGTDALGRSGFYIHGDNAEHLGQSSHGCVILPRSIRALMAVSEDRTLRVEL
jgi:hypothetical protein